jgi:hypothetical protein
MRTLAHSLCRTPALAVVASLAIACSSKDTKEFTNERVAGIWQWQSGPLVPGAELGDFGYLELTRSGQGTLYTKSAGGVVGCPGFIYAVLDDRTLTLQLPIIVREGDSSIQYYSYDATGDTLTVTDQPGNATIFHRATAVPAASQCGTVAAETVALTTPATSRGGLAAAGTALTYTSSDEQHWIRYDTETGATTSVAVPLAVGQYVYVQATQGDDLWLTCHCGSDQAIQRRQPSGTLVTTIDIGAAPINHTHGVQAATRDATRLWLATYAEDAATFELFKIDSDATHALEQRLPVDVHLDAVSFLGARLFAIGNFFGPVLIELDPTTGAVLATWRLPDHEYGGLAAVGDSLYAQPLDGQRLQLLKLQLH